MYLVGSWWGWVDLQIPQQRGSRLRTHALLIESFIFIVARCTPRYDLSQNDSRIEFNKFAGRSSASDNCGDVYRGPNYSRTSIVPSGLLGENCEQSLQFHELNLRVVTPELQIGLDYLVPGS